jgi:hypothetical protein
MAAILKDFGDTFTFIDKDQVLCNVCSQHIIFRSKKQKLQQHIETDKHLQYLQGTSHEEFFRDICEAFISGNIPLHELNNPQLRACIS